MDALYIGFIIISRIIFINRLSTGLFSRVASSFVPPTPTPTAVF